VPLRARVVRLCEHFPRGWTRRCCSRPREAGTSTTTSGDGASGPRRYGRRIEHRRIYDCRHTSPFGRSRGRATRLPRRDHGHERGAIDATYGHLLPDSEAYLRGLLDEYDERPSQYWWMGLCENSMIEPPRSFRPDAERRRVFLPEDGTALSTRRGLDGVWHLLGLSPVRFAPTHAACAAALTSETRVDGKLLVSSRAALPRDELYERP
jgi:hypothetical protein